MRIADWKKENNLTYKKGQNDQLKKITNIGRAIGIDPTIVGKHFSKLVSLPVSLFKFKDIGNTITKVYIRDNFYNIKCSVIASYPIYMSMSSVHREVTKEELEEQIEKYCNYCKKEKPTDDNWYYDWNGGTILRDNNRIYLANSVKSCYCEGINSLDLPDSVFTPYREGRKHFTVELDDYFQVVNLLIRISYHAGATIDDILRVDKVHRYLK